MVLQSQQASAFRKLSRFVLGPDLFFVLKGFAGTGKTFLLKETTRHPLLFPCPLYTATTNKATKVLKSNLGPDVFCKTIYSALGIRMVSDEDQMVLEFPRKPPDSIWSWRIIFVDEASMVTTGLLDYIKHIAVQYRIKFVFVADRAQVPPVGEEESPIWDLDCPEYELTNVLRYDNEILQLATHIRKQIFKFPNYKLRLKSNHGATEGVWVTDRAKFIRGIQSAASKGLFTQVDNTKVVAWRNKTVAEFNDIIRQTIFGARSLEPFLPNDRLLIRQPVLSGQTILHHIDDEGTVDQVGVGYHGQYRDVDCFHLTVRFDDGRSTVLNVVTPDATTRLLNSLSELALKAKKDKKLWPEFWALKNAFHRVSYSYALTIHRSQGSTFKNTFVDTSDILANSNKFEALRCFYVGATRATDKVILT